MSWMERIPEPEYMDLPDEADAYAKADFGDVNDAVVERLLEVCPFAPGDSVRAIDLGTGPGDIPQRVSSARRQWWVVGVDASEAMLRIAQSRRLPNLTWTLVDAKSLPFAKDTFDLVFTNSILHHVEDTSAFWAEVRRIVKPGGYVFVRDLARPATCGQAQQIVENYSGNESELLKEEFYRSLLAAYTVDEVGRQLDAAGLSELRVAMSSDRHLDVFGTIAESSRAVATDV